MASSLKLPLLQISLGFIYTPKQLRRYSVAQLKMVIKSVLQDNLRSMKIGIIAHIKHPIIAPFAGGLEAFTYKVTNSLKKRGHEVTLCASSLSNTDGVLCPILDDNNYNGLSGFRQKKPDMCSEYIAEHHAYFDLMTEIDAMEFDIIFNNSLHYVPITMAGLLNTPLVTVLHTPPFYELEKAITAERKRKSINYITISAANARNWKDYIPDCPYILNGIDLKEWGFYEHGRQKDYAVWFGRIHPDKGLEYAIKAAKAARIHLKIAGGIADERYYKNKIQPLIDDNVELLGLLDQRQLNKLIGEAKVCLITPIWQEPFGLVVAEALACGTPVAGFDTGALKEVLGNQHGVLVAPGNISALAAAINQAACLDRMEARVYAEHYLSTERMLDEYEDLFNAIIISQSKIAS